MVFFPPNPPVTSDQLPITDCRLLGKCTVTFELESNILLNWFVTLPKDVDVNAGNDIDVKDEQEPEPEKILEENKNSDTIEENQEINGNEN